MTTHEELAAITRKYGLTPPMRTPQTWTGAASHVYPLGDMVVKIPFDRPDTIEAVRTDAAIVPIVRTHGVPAPELVTFDDSGEIISVPFAIFRRVGHTVSLQQRDRHWHSIQDTWMEVGRQIARVHRVRREANFPVELRVFRQTPDVDPRLWVDELHANGALNEDDARWLQMLLEQLAPFALEDVPLTLCHGDVNAANILVDERTHRFRALIDWAGAGWLDPVWDFAGMSLDAVPYILSGHRSITPLPLDHTAEARILWCQLQMRLFAVRKARHDGDGVAVPLDEQARRLRQFARDVGFA